MLEHDHEPVMTITALLTQSKKYSLLEGYCAKPGLDKALSNALGKALWDYAFEFLKGNNYENVLCFTDRPKLVKRYEELGMRKIISNMTCLARAF